MNLEDKTMKVLHVLFWTSIVLIALFFITGVKLFLVGGLLSLFLGIILHPD